RPETTDEVRIVIRHEPVVRVDDEPALRAREMWPLIERDEAGPSVLGRPTRSNIDPVLVGANGDPRGHRKRDLACRVGVDDVLLWSAHGSKSGLQFGNIGGAIDSKKRFRSWIARKQGDVGECKYMGIACGGGGKLIHVRDDRAMTA